MVNTNSTQFQDACTYLDDMQMHKIKLGLDAVRSVLSVLGSPELKCPAVHVAGTNGKGSVCSMLRAMLTSAGYRTGLYTSPHLSSIRERFRIDDEYIGEDEFTIQMERIRSSLNGKSITYFECATALAFSWFAERACDLVIVETGMGGRLDATNVLVPLISVITTISLDHEQYLGDTIEEIAFEKAGIIKAGVPVISGVLEPKAKRVIEQACGERNSVLATRDSDFSMKRGENGEWAWHDLNSGNIISGLSVPHGGGWQVENTGCAIAAAVMLRDKGFTITDEAIRGGLTKSHWPGRMEFLNVACTTGESGGKNLRFLLDGAHNSAGVDYLIDMLKDGIEYDKLYLVWASMADKTYELMLKKTATIADYVMLTRPDSERAAVASDLAAVLENEVSGKNVFCSERVEDSLREVCLRAGQDDLIVVAGSLYLVGEFRKLLVGEVVS